MLAHDLEAERVLAEARAGHVRLTRVMWCGNDGLIRAKALTTATLQSRLRGGVGLSSAQPVQNALDQIASGTDRGPVGEMRLVPDPGTFRFLPFAPSTAGMLGDLHGLDGKPDPTCPRDFLRRMLRRAYDLALRPVIGFENEFALAHDDAGTWEPIDRSACFSTSGALASQDFMDDLLEALGALEVVVDGCHAEGGWGQNEVALGPTDALRAADDQIFVREAIRATAMAHELAASLSPKPFVAGAGNGLHVHVSLRSAAGENLFFDPDADGAIGDVGRSFVAGLLAHLPALCAITAPSVPSYLRLAPSAWAGSWRCWGYDNREAAVRACSAFSGRAAQSVNVEYKPSDASASPYLTVGALLAAGLDGVRLGLAPPLPVQVDPATLPAEERSERGIEALPSSPSEALNALETDDVLRDALGDELLRTFIAVRRSEAKLYENAGADKAVADHFLRC
jgi:glutamine synthetase